MFIMTEEEYDRERGTDMPMLSRIGKNTVCMYAAFSQAAANKKEL